jgi:hypothetical protein
MGRLPKGLYTKKSRTIEIAVRLFLPGNSGLT